MMQRLILYLSVLALLTAALYVSDQRYKDKSLLSDYAQELSVYIAQQAVDATAWASSHAHMHLPGAASGGARTDLEGQAGVAFTVLVYASDSLVGWNNNHAIPLEKPRMAASGSWGLLDLPGGVFAARQIRTDPEVWVLAPIRYAGDRTARVPLFPANPAMPATVRVLPDDAGEPVVADGRVLCSLQAQGSLQPFWVQSVRAVLWFLFLVIFIVMMYRVADLVRAKRGFGLSLGVLGLAVVAPVLWSSAVGYMETAFPDITWLSCPFEPAFLGLPTVGDFLQAVFMLLLCIGYALRRFPERLSATSRGLWTAAAVLSVLIGAGLSVLLWRQLEVNPGIAVDADAILNTNSAGLALLLGGLLLQIGFIMLGLVFWRYRMDDAHRAPGLIVLLSGLILQALFNTVFVYSSHRSAEDARRSHYAVSLAEERDSAAEADLSALRAALEQDPQPGNLLKPWPFKPERSDLEGYVLNAVFHKPYLFQHYKLRAFAFDAQQLPLFREQSESWDAVAGTAWDKSVPVSGDAPIRYGPGVNDAFVYTLRLRPNRMGDPTQPADLLLAFQRDYPMPNRVYARLFFQTPYKSLTRLPEYDFAVHRNDRVQVEYGRVDPGVWQPVPQPGQVRLENNDFAVARSRSGESLSAVGRAGTGGIHRLYLFSILFSLGTLIVLLLVALNRFLLIAPEGGLVSLNARGSLARRIHLGSVGLIGCAFVVVSALTYWHFSDVARSNTRAGQHARADAVVNSLRRAVGDHTSLRSDSLHNVALRPLAELAGGLDLDMQVYDTHGMLLAGTQQELIQVGILPARMSPWAMHVLGSGALPQLSVPEKTGGRAVEQRYQPLRNLSNEIIGFVAVPFSDGYRVLGQEVSDFIGILATLFMSLLLVAFVVTLAVVNSIIRPLKLISEKIRQFRLDNQNQPLEYTGSSQDELSDLIAEYNRMVDQLEASKGRMIRLEREGAWREMARQVAHDIKNPLTTMKLSMQQLERVSNDPAQAAAYLKKAITRLIEQIDSLAQIASEFSMFANLDIQKKSDMVINDVVESVYDLFSEQKDVTLRLDVPYERFHINGDKNHLIRVFNNLIINAIQAIPSDRKGKIRVSLYRHNDLAVVQISDNGGGIPPEIRDRVFEPNFTTKTSGSGLGLAICRKIVEALDGQIRFETRDNEGTDFFVEFPITREEVAEVVG
ncbi:MAG: HAMP domain-containing sensor histidine kinase [Saprospiraceae bacterium]|nr:HAMP domain-containing sensor histidine kinase [Saprospiraceae bacterium]